MAFAVRWIALVAAVASIGLAQPPTEKARTVDALPLPPGTVIFVTPDPRAANPNVDAVILTPEEYRKLLESAERLQKLSVNDGVVTPAVCRLDLRFDSETQNARITARYQFRTETPRAIVSLGLQKSRPISAQLENEQLPTLKPATDGGFQIVAETPGEYRLTLEALVPLQRLKGQAQQIEFSLPGAAITLLEKVQLPPDALRLRINDQLTAVPKNDSAVVLGPIKNLTATWDDSPIIRPGEPVIAVDSRIDVRTEDRQLITHARLNVSVLRGQVGDFLLTAPASAKITTPNARDVTLEPPTDTRRTTWILKRKSAPDDLVIDITTQQLMARRPLLVHGFPITGAAAQRGLLTLKTPDAYRVSVTPRIELIRRDDRSAPAADRSEVYEFSSIPVAGILADLELQPVRGEVETAYAHQLQLTDNAWRLTSRLEVRPIRRELDRLELELPPELRDIRVGPPDLVDSSGPIVETLAGQRIMPLRLTEPSRRPVSLSIEGTYPIAAGVTSAGLVLPRLTGGLDRGGAVQIVAAPGIEVRGEVREWDRDRVGDWQQSLESTREGHWHATLEHAPARVDLSWRYAGIDLAVQSTIDVEFEPRQGWIRQVIRFPSAPRQFVLRGPAELADRLNVIDGANLSVAAPGEWVCRPTAVAGRDVAITLQYSFPFDPTGPVTVPLLWMDDARRCETDVRIWAAPSSTGPQMPVVESRQWTTMPPPVVPDRPRLPALAVRTMALKVPLQVHFGEGMPNLPVAVIDRVWVRAVVDEVGAVMMRTRFHARTIRNEPLPIRLPGPAMLLRPSVRLDGKAVDVSIADQQLMVSLGPAGGEHIIDVYCTLPARSGWSVRLDAPRPIGPMVLGAVRWQIRGPEGDVGFETSGELAPIVRWNWQRGLLAPGPGISDGAMVRWFAGDQGHVAVEPFDAALTATSTGLPTIWITYWPRTAITVAASLLALAIGGLVLMISWTVRRLALLLVGMIGLFLAYCSWPQVFGQLFALAQPGLWVLVPAGLIGAWARRRSTRQAVFAPLRLVVPQGATVVAKTAV